MKKVSLITITAPSVVLLSGCTTAQKVISAMGYSTSTYVTQQQLDGFLKGKTRQVNVIASIGNSPHKAEIMGKEVWPHTHTLIPALPLKPDKFETPLSNLKRTTCL